jgi:hypothetical protein
MEAVAPFTLGLWVGLLAGLHLGWFRGGATGPAAQIGGRAVPHLPEAQAQRQLVEDAIERGALEIMDRNPGMSKKEARRIAATTWAKAGDMLGGVQ